MASEEVPSVALADCALILRNLSGIFISGLPFEDATAFQIALKRQGFLTDVVSDDEIPVLHEPFTIQRIQIREKRLVFTDSLGRESVRPIDELVFIAGGFLTQTKIKSELISENLAKRTREDAYNTGLERKFTSYDLPEFRLDFFFWSAPNRLRASISADGILFFHGRPIRLKDTTLLLGAMMDLRELLPCERVGSGLKRSDTTNAYPSLRSYEEEIRWHFLRLSKKR